MDILRMLRQAYRSRRQRKAWKRVVQVMAMIVVFCTTYALILPAITLERDAACGFTEHTHTEACYGTAPLHTHEEDCCKYNLICGLAEQEGHTHTDSCNGVVTTLICTADHVHEATCYSYETGLTCGLEETAGHSHDASCYEKELICGLEEGAPEGEPPLICELDEHTHTDTCYPETEETTEPTEESSEPTEETTEPTEAPEDTQNHTYAGQDLQAQVSLGTDTSVPADADLTISAIEAGSEDYAAMETQLQSLVEQEILDLSLLDISFYDAAGEYLSVSDTATVTLTFNGMLYTDSIVTMYHFVDGTPVALEPPQINYTSLTAEDGTETTQTRLTFQTEGFSIFAVVAVVGPYQRVDLTDTAQLDNDSFYIVSNSGAYGMTATLNTNGDGLAKEAVSITSADFGATPKWTFTKNADGTYYIHSGDKYLLMEETTDSVAALTVTTEAFATAFDVSIHDDGNGIGQVVISYTGKGIAHYVNLYQGNNGPGFYGWLDPPANDGGSKNYLYRDLVATETSVPATGLDGKSFAIVSNLVAKGLTTNTVTVNGVSGLASTNVTITTEDGVSYVEGDIPVWTFTATDTAGVYHIYTENATGDKQYLRLLDAHYQNTSDGRGSLTLGTEPQAIRVSANDDGTVYLSYTDENNVTGYINLDTAVYHFWTYSNTADADKLLLCSLTDIDESFTITYNGNALTVCFVDGGGNPLYRECADIEMTDGQTLDFAELALKLDIPDHVYSLARTDNSTTGAPIEYVTSNVDNWAFRLYGPDYPEDSGNYYSRNEGTVYLIYTSNVLHYNLNLPHSNHWINVPMITETKQQITTDGASLQTIKNENEAGTFVYNTLSGGVRGTITDYYENYNNNRGESDPYLAPGREYYFVNWKATVNGTDYFFDADAVATLNADGNICIEDTSGIIQTLPAGTTLFAQWSYNSDIVIFFVNFGDTMLTNEDYKKLVGTAKEYYTNVVAFGHIYNPTTISPPQNSNEEDLISKAVHAQIEAELVFSYDPNNSGTQIVIDAVADGFSGTMPQYKQVSNYNEVRLEQAVAAYLQNDPDTNTQVKLGNAHVDKKEINSNNYSLHWYSQKYSATGGNDAWHIDGVLVANTQKTHIIKTFSGLTRTQTDSLIEKMSFPLYLVRDEDTAAVAEYYYELIASETESGIYSYDGPLSDTSNIYQWTLESVLGQRYSVQELGYTLDGYDCFSLVSAHYFGIEMPIYCYDTDMTFQTLVKPEDPSKSNPEIEGNDLFASAPLEGGKLESLIFANFYTSKGTGMFSISKVADADGQDRLSGAVFQLKDSNGNIVMPVNHNDDGTGTTNEYGSIHYSDLVPGIYTLKELTAPAGYQAITNQWKVEVAREPATGDVTDTTQVTVTIWEEDVNGAEVYGTRKLVYDRLGTAEGNTTDHKGVLEVYPIRNTPYDTTIKVNKYFTTITAEEINELTNYGIQVWQTQADGTQKLLKTLTLNDATIITDALNGYTWTLTQEDGIQVNWSEDQKNIQYHLVEVNYLLDSKYFDTVVTAQQNGNAVPVTKLRTGDTETAEFSITKSDSVDVVNITNDYTNTFRLKIIKENATAQTEDEKYIAGVEFKLYSPEGDLAQSDETITYTDENGNLVEVYYIGTTKATDADGITWFDNMTLIKGSKSFLFVIDEVDTPAGFVELNEPIVQVVNVDSENYKNGIYTLTVENFKPALATVSVTATKEWNLPKDMDPTPIVLNLYQRKPDDTVTLLHTVTLDGTDKEETLDGITATVTDWTVTWKGLPYADSAVRNEYYISEPHMDGYSTSYYTDYGTTVETRSVTVDGKTEQIAMVQAKGEKELVRFVTVTNATSYALPESGGMGTGWHTCLGLSLILACVWLYWRGIYKKKRGGADSS